MTDCRYCGTAGAYDSGFSVECVNEKCAKYCQSWASQNSTLIIQKRPTVAQFEYDTHVFDVLAPFTWWILGITSHGGDSKIIRTFFRNMTQEQTPYVCRKNEVRLYRPSNRERLYGAMMQVFPCEGSSFNMDMVFGKTAEHNTQEERIISDMRESILIHVWHTQEQFKRYTTKELNINP